MARNIVLGNLHCRVESADCNGFDVHRVFLEDCWRREAGFRFGHRDLAKAMDGALRQAFGVFTPEAQTIIETYALNGQADNGRAFYQVTLRLIDGKEISASAGSEGLAVFGALWQYYRSAYPQAEISALGNLQRQLETVKLS